MRHTRPRQIVSHFQPAAVVFRAKGDIDPVRAARSAHDRLQREQHQRLLARDRIDHDLRLARQIQRNLLPRDPPRVAGVDIAVHYEPAFHVGGDFYDFLWRDQQQLSIVVGDVSGKAISGALFMARVTSEIRAVASLGSPARVIERVNRALAEIADDGMFVTLVYVTIDLRRNTIRFCNAGHTTPLLRRGDEVLSLEFDRARCMPVGVLPTLQCDEVEVPLIPGDVLLLYTDGIIEARSMKGEFYGQDRLVEAVIAANTREELEAGTAALDRALLWGHYVIPHWYSDVVRVAYWDKLAHPGGLPPYGIAFDAWWVRPAAMP